MEVAAIPATRGAEGRREATSLRGGAASPTGGPLARGRLAIREPNATTSEVACPKQVHRKAGIARRRCTCTSQSFSTMDQPTFALCNEVARNKSNPVYQTHHDMEHHVDDFQEACSFVKPSKANICCGNILSVPRGTSQSACLLGALGHHLPR